MCKFKVGDKVRILDGSKINNYFGCWIDGMKNHVDKVYTVESISARRHNETTGYHMKEIGYVWDERGLELVTENKSKNKFNIGDVVVAKKNNGYFFTTDGWKGVVTKTTTDWLDAEEFGYPKQKYEHLRYDGFKLSNDQKIVITHNGKMTIAKFFEGDKCIKTAKAKCCPSDEFDFNIGAAIALERLTGCAYGHLESTLDSDLQWNRFIADKIALKVPKEKIEKFLKGCEESGLKWDGGERATAWNPVKDSLYTFGEYVYMYHNDGSLSYEEKQRGNYAFEVWEDAFDWDGFKAGKFNVVVTRDSSDRFLEECEAHDITYGEHSKATDFNPIKDLDKINPFTKAMILAVLEPESTDKCEFEVKEGDLLYSFNIEIKESTVKYD